MYRTLPNYIESGTNYYQFSTFITVKVDNHFGGPLKITLTKSISIGYNLEFTVHNCIIMQNLHVRISLYILNTQLKTAEMQSTDSLDNITEMPTKKWRNKTCPAKYGIASFWALKSIMHLNKFILHNRLPLDTQ